MKKIELSNSPGTFAIVDDEDYEYLSQFTWTLTKTGYVVRSKRRKETNAKNLAMHRIVAECPEGMTVDHINFDKLDNRKENLRIITRESNSSHQPSGKKKPVQIVLKKEKLYHYNRLLTREQIKKVDEFINNLNMGVDNQNKL